MKVTALAAIDLSAAFDKVDNAILLDVFRIKFGITDQALNWFASYLQPSNFMVEVGESYSNKKELTLFRKAAVQARRCTPFTQVQCQKSSQI